MTVELKGAPVVKHIKKNLKSKVLNLKTHGITPMLYVIRLGNLDKDISYEKSIQKNCESIGIDFKVEVLDPKISSKELEKVIKKANENRNIHGIMLYRPLPSHIDEREIALSIDPKKDVDAMSPVNLGKTFEETETGFSPCTAKAVIEMLKFNNFEFEGKHAVIVGRSLVVGKPLGMLFLNENSTVSITHTKTLNLKELTQKADVVITASGQPKIFDMKYFNENSIIIDVGVSLDECGKLSGDVDYEKVFGKVKAITPVPGGVGAITTNVLMEQVVRACEDFIEI